MSTTIDPIGSATGRPAPIAAAIGSSISDTRSAPALVTASRIARRSTEVAPDGMQITTSGPREKRLRAAVRLADEMLDHLLGDFEVGDDAVAQAGERCGYCPGSCRASAWRRRRPRGPCARR